MKITIKTSSGRTVEVDARILKRRQMFGRKEILIDGRLASPIWVTVPKK